MRVLCVSVSCVLVVPVVVPVAAVVPVPVVVVVAPVVVVERERKKETERDVTNSNLAEWLPPVSLCFFVAFFLWSFFRFAFPFSSSGGSRISAVFPNVRLERA